VSNAICATSKDHDRNKINTLGPPVMQPCISAVKEPVLPPEHHPEIPAEFNPLKPELNPICYLLALLGADHFLHVSRIRVNTSV